MSGGICQRSTTAARTSPPGREKRLYLDISKERLSAEEQSRPPHLPLLLLFFFQVTFFFSLINKGRKARLFIKIAGDGESKFGCKLRVCLGSSGALLGCLPIPQLLKHWGLITWHYGNADRWGGYFIYSTPNQRLETRSANQSALSAHACV